MTDEIQEVPDPHMVGWKLKARNETESWSELSFVAVFDYGPDEETGEPVVDEMPDYTLNVSMARDEAPPVSLGETIGVRWDFAPDA